MTTPRSINALENLENLANEVVRCRVGWENAQTELARGRTGLTLLAADLAQIALNRANTRYSEALNRHAQESEAPKA